MDKVLISKTYNNGYGCRCCAQYWSTHRWVEEGTYTKIAVLKLALSQRRKMGEDHLVKFLVEKNGKVLFGFQCDVVRVGEYLYWISEGDGKTLLCGLDEGNIRIKTAVRRLGNRF